MRLGLLDCHHMPERYRPIAGTYTDMFRALVAAVDPAIEVVGYDARGGELPRQVQDCDAWLLTGSSASVYDDAPWIAALRDLVGALQAAHAPTVGVCFGHQLLAHALGGRTERAATGWGVGALTMAITEATDWMDPPLAAATLLYSHQDQVTVLPPGARVLAAADHCPIAMLAIGDHALGIQAHPELGRPYVEALLEDRVDRIGAAGTAAAVETLARPTHERQVAAWLLGFLRQRVAGRG